jgi:sporulation protein YlmC with PRC-barrel domain
LRLAFAPQAQIVKDCGTIDGAEDYLWGGTPNGESQMRRTILAAALVALPVLAFADAQMTHFVTLDKNDMLGSNVIGVDVYDMSNHDIGTIKDVAFDGSKTLKGYIVSVGGFLGMGTHYVAVDADSVKVKYDSADKKWHANMNASKDELKAAPEFKYEGEWDASKS